MDQQKRNRLWPLWLLLPLGTVYYFCKFVLPGYSFTALVCLCLAALILFYVAMPFLGQRFPKAAKLLTRCVTAVLIVGLLICGVTEGIIIRASFGSPDQDVDYVVVLGAKVRDDGPSVPCGTGSTPPGIIWKPIPTPSPWSPAARARTSL